jgi:hypothetical protein
VRQVGVGETDWSYKVSPPLIPLWMAIMPSRTSQVRQIVRSFASTGSTFLHEGFVPNYLSHLSQTKGGKEAKWLVNRDCLVRQIERGSVSAGGADEEPR